VAETIEQYAQRERAMNKVSQAKAKGILVILPCRVCGAVDVQAHHPRGYSDEHALDVEWLCSIHHRQAHFVMRGRNVSDLTYREMQVSEYVVAGLKAKEIADLLGLSEQTVKNTKVAIYQKLGVRNAVELTLKLKEPA